MSIKKPYVELIDFLSANKDKKVSSILDSVKEFCESKKSANTIIKDADGNVTHVFCWYHKQWESIIDVPYGSKANTQSGLNTMCKVGVSKWTKSQRDAKAAKEELLDGVSSGDIKVEDIKRLQEDIEQQRCTIDTTDMPIGFENESDIA